ncbi:unnamed protein product [Nyctereutes procyonoides]|uniref:(raccoon dog) hypothetical protein n=1 Tax=Nyctereutes procyonoides TaxID=34880 RepID=A0A811Z4U5_NYCPR|nr:unnamed protein product [Nyctereutes procyonoides]
MNVGVAHREIDLNTGVMNSPGIWLAYIALVGLLHVVLLSIPFFSIPIFWTLTNIIHTLTPDQEKTRLLTHWEQMDYGLQNTSSCKFPQFHTKYDAAHFLINTASLLSILLAKLPQFHGVHLFGINKY